MPVGPYETLLWQTLSECDGHLTTLAATIRKAVMKAGGVRRQELVSEREQVDLESPAVFNSSQFWDY